jgi:hypothetical protein
MDKKASGKEYKDDHYQNSPVGMTVRVRTQERLLLLEDAAESVSVPVVDLATAKWTKEDKTTYDDDKSVIRAPAMAAVCSSYPLHDCNFVKGHKNDLLN